MIKLLVNTPSGKQELITIGEGGGYFDPSLVLWDERIDGAMPAITLGAMVRIGNVLVVDAALEASTVAANQARAIEQVQSAIVTAVQNRLDDFAKTRNYDGILSACTYAAGSVPKFSAEGQYCVSARDGTWAALYTIMAEVQAGTRPMPASFTDIEPALPALTWPA